MLGGLQEVRRMATTAVRIDERTRSDLQELSELTGESMRELVAQAVEHYRRRRFLEQVNRDFERLRADPEAWAAELEERRFWDAVVADRPRQP
jgi:hypothetical protein